METPTRRQVLATTAVSVATAVAGCSSGGDATTTDPEDTETEAPTDTEAETTAESTPTTTEGSGATSVVVGPNGDFRFAPASVTVSVGDTVEWVWSSGGHNVVADSTPDGADWSGTEGAPSAVYDAGHAYSHTFEVAGTYTYYCNPHRGSGMTGEVVVEE